MNVVGGNLTLTLGPFDGAQAVSRFDFVIHYDNDTWDNNGGADYHVTVTGASVPRTYTLDGSLDAGITKVASNAGIDLYLDWNGTELYVATQAASGVGQDVFALVAPSRGTLVAAPWAKAGQAGQWTAFLGNESTNNYCGWTGATGAANKAAGAMLEGTLNLAGQLGSVPAVVYVAIGRYATADGGALAAQCPAGDGNANLDGAEYLAFAIGGAGVTPLGAASVPHLLPLAPSPARGAVTLAYVLPYDATVALEVYDVRGRLVATPEAGIRAAGVRSATWDAAGAPAGVYFARLRAGGVTSTRRVLVVR
jgi:hypothetical protein